ncbi:MAG TPA: hypothetical protein PLO51_05980, partial [Candidatus Micrarchaeota archaeon]|nr:hypothetical protein [Candidatus Micrarchaeota archaeon]
AIFPLFLFTGVILRTFFFTRKLGGLMIALALGAYLTLPAMYAFTGYLMYQTTNGTYNALLFNVSFDPAQAAGIGQDSGFNPYKPIAKDSYQFTADQAPVGPLQKLDYGTCLAGETYVFTSNQTVPWPPPANFILKNRYDESNTLTVGTVTSTGADALNFTDTSGGQYEIKMTTDANNNYLYMVFAINNGQPASPGTLSTIYNTLKSWASSVQWFISNDLSTSFESMVAGDEIIGHGGLIDQTARLMLFTLVMPFISLMVTIASVKVMSPRLGGDTEIAGLTRII